MTSLHRVVVEWTGTHTVGRSVSVLHFAASEGGAPPVADIRAAYAAVTNALATGVTVQVPGSGDIINDVTGELVGTWSAPAPAPVVGAGSGNSPNGVGACVTWNTGGVVPGKKGPRRLRGRTFLVPLSGNSYDPNGTLLDASLPLFSDFATQMMAAGPLAVWHRPNAALGLVGNSYGVVSFKIRDKVAFLSSRRD